MIPNLRPFVQQPKRISRGTPLADRLARNIDFQGMDKCWEWRGDRTIYGYGYQRCEGTRAYAHRLVYEFEIGPIPEGLDLDHLCRNRGCVNPLHLEPVTHRENMLRGDTFAARQAKATHCPQGHPYDEANTYRHRGHRQCQICRRERNRVWSEQRR